MILNAKLRIEHAAVNPPKPTAIGVFDGDNKLVASIEIEEFKRAAAQLERMEAARRAQ